jgi:hypothetical protein
VFESVLACDSENHTRPSVSKAAIMDSLGITDLRTTLQELPFGAQVRLINEVSFSQVSSMLITLVLYSRSFINSRAYCWRSTLHRAELA